MFGNKKRKEAARKSSSNPKFKKLKTIDELEDGRCIIVTVHGKIASCVGPGLQTLLPVPNSYVIYGFIQNKRTAQKPAKNKAVSERLANKRLKQGEKLLKKERKKATASKAKKSEMNKSIQKWYQDNYPTDEFGLRLCGTFADLQEAINNGADVHKAVLGIDNKIARKRIFKHLAEIQGKK